MRVSIRCVGLGTVHGRSDTENLWTVYVVTRESASGDYLCPEMLSCVELIPAGIRIKSVVRKGKNFE